MRDLPNYPDVMTVSSIYDLLVRQVGTFLLVSSELHAPPTLASPRKISTMLMGLPCTRTPHAKGGMFPFIKKRATNAAVLVKLVIPFLNISECLGGTPWPSGGDEMSAAVISSNVAMVRERVGTLV